ncbi:MAG: hypothetical protein ACM3ZA_02150 [Bacillota bacterium]
MSVTKRTLSWALVIVLAAAALVVWLGPSGPLRQKQPAPSPVFTSPPPGVVPTLVSDNDLVERAMEVDGQWVVYQGEALGDLMVRGDTAWLNVGGASYAIGVLMPADEAAKVKTLGNYRFNGDTVRVVGIFHRADPAQGGDLDIVASSLEVVKPGAPRPEPRPGNRVYTAAALSLLALVLFLTTHRVRRRSEGGEPHLGDAG